MFLTTEKTKHPVSSISRTDEKYTHKIVKKLSPKVQCHCLQQSAMYFNS